MQQSIDLIHNAIREYELRYDRQPHSVSLLAVSKRQPIEKIQQAIAAGQFDFGENYLQEALIKINALSDKKIIWHFIGTIQSNKTKKIAEHFAWVHSVDNLQIAQRLNDQRPSHLPPLNICLQVNINDESSKSGASADRIFSLAKSCLALPRLKLRGLMALPAPTNDFSAQRAAFHKINFLFEKLNTENLKLDTLSMGTSQDLEAAIAEGATIVRIGTAIFGGRS